MALPAVMQSSLVAILVLLAQAAEYDNLFSVFGYGTCVDSAGRQYDGWSGTATFSECQGLCDEARDCTGFDFHHGDGGDGPKDWCELRFNDGTAPAMPPSKAMRHSHFNHQGDGPPTKVYLDKQNFKRKCYSKKRDRAQEL
mmetsp:Transcript_51226/g.120068  ORF Transcript_51226/g.120068 Transcript_51226/m.120068 type:complete len:141 (+) Transcript_51226:53-475(+)